jgi:hypothetical protein
LFKIENFLTEYLCLDSRVEIAMFRWTWNASNNFLKGSALPSLKRPPVARGSGRRGFAQAGLKLSRPARLRHGEKDACVGGSSIGIFAKK